MTPPSPPRGLTAFTADEWEEIRTLSATGTRDEIDSPLYETELANWSLAARALLLEIAEDGIASGLENLRRRASILAADAKEEG